MLLKYEDMRSNPYESLKKVVKFCGMETIISENAIKKAVENRFCCFLS